MATGDQPFRVVLYVEADGTRPFVDWSRTIPVRMTARLMAVVDAVADAPPHRFAGGGQWEAMHGEMAGWFEVRQRGGGRLYRVFCLLDSTTSATESTLVVVAGMAKPVGTVFSTREYAAIRAMGERYWATLPRPVA